ncbi:outer membrane beta-barrel protein [Lachnospiraceae bacterium OttesenSCG-928-E19]|nr:outer membrane beta-barrel protein [Lachnospiraceae bacterium OttesenSCG-928-E19]
MKNIVSVFVLLGLTVSVADAAPSYIARDGDHGYNVTYNYTDKEKTGWYLTARAGLGLLNWENEYYSPDVGSTGKDKYSFEPVFDGSLSVGRKFGHFWRGEIEAGYMGLFTDEEYTEFPDGWHRFNTELSAAYLMANAMYDFSNGVYVGGGLGLAMVMSEMDSSTGAFLPGGKSKSTISPMAGLMVGYTRKLDDNFVVDLRYRIAGLNGTKQTRSYEVTTPTPQTFSLENKIGLIFENSFSIALRYEF